MKRVQPISFASTASFGGYLHWASHYLQSPLSAMHGYLGMLADPAFAKQSPELIANAHVCSERAQAVLSSLAALHKLLDAQEAKPQRTDLGQLLGHVASQPQAFFEVQRSRALPQVLAVAEPLEVGLTMLCMQLRLHSDAKNCVVSFRQRRDEAVLHLQTKQTKPEFGQQLGTLARIPVGRYPLPPGDLIPLATALILLRCAGAAIVVRPTTPASLDVYIHLPLVRQLALLDLKPS